MASKSKLLLVVLDGAADRPEAALDGCTPLELASTPHLDALIASAKGALVEVLPHGAVPQTHSGMLSFLGYPEIALKAKRGSLEAAVIFEHAPPNTLFARGNLSSLVDGKIPSRRVNRDVTQPEADELCAYLTERIGHSTPIACQIKSYSTYRLAVALTLDGLLSDAISNTDPGYAVNADYVVPDTHAMFSIAWSEPLSGDPAARYTSDNINLFTRQVHEMLDIHPINRARRDRGQLPINHILLRDFGMQLPPIESFEARWGLKAKYFHDLPVEYGVARYLSIDAEEAHCKDASVASYHRAADAVLEALVAYDAIIFHIKGPDEPGHDGSWQGKKAALERIDQGFFANLPKSRIGGDVTLCVTSDHATCWAIGTHTADKVALAVASGSDPSRAHTLRLTERQCAENTIPIASAWQLMPYLTTRA